MNGGPVNPSSAFAVVVNDDPTQLSVLCELVRKAGLEPRGFTGAEAALAAMSADPATADGTPRALPALVVTDLHMPGIDGWRFCRLLRSPDYVACNHIPILVVSATFSGDETDRIATELGADGFLPAPVEGHRFVDRVRAILRGDRLRIPLRVLIVEDSTTLANLLARAFAAHSYHADTALTARAAADAFRLATYDVAVLDYHLPDGTGDALLDAFRAERPDCVCIMITSDPEPALALDWMKRGAAAFLHKPFEPDYLIELCAKARRERALLRVQDLLELRTQRLRESEEKHRILLEESSDPIFSLTRDGEYAYVNRAFASGVGKTVADIIGKRIWDVFPREEADKRFAALSEVFRTGKEKVIEVRVPNADGNRYFVTAITPIRDAAGQVVSAICSAKDITERKRTEEALSLSQLRLRLFIDANSDLLFLKDLNLKYQMVNAANAAFLGRGEADILGYTDADLMPEQAARACRETDLHAIRQKGPVTAIESVGDKVYETHKFPVMIDSEVVGVAGIIRDITERKVLEAQLQQAQKMESVGRLAGGVAHDFNNMLGAILGYVELALEQVDPSQPLHADLEEIRTAATRSADLTRQLLAFARKQTVAPRVLDLNETITGTLKMLGRLIGEDIRLAWKPGADVWPVRVDPSQIDQILANLCVNARDAIADVGTITIETGNSTFDAVTCAVHAGLVPGEYVRLAVSDDGCGMNRDTLAHIFEPFFTTKDVGKGTGLGLATVYGAVKQNHGFIQADSEPGQGTTFTIYLPRHVGKPGQAQTDVAAGPARRGHETILLVEDEPAILRLTTVMLERQGYTVLAASTPGEAIRLAREYAGEIRLLMTDVVMPEMNGRDLARNLLSVYPRLPRLFMSGYADDVISHHGVLDDGVFFIQKPFSIADLVAKVREALDRA
jgi:PAS domain S-box-containing protein